MTLRKTVEKYGRVHHELAEEILEIIEKSAVTGEPVVRISMKKQIFQDF